MKKSKVISGVERVIRILANLRPEETVERTTKTKHPQEHGEQEGFSRG